MTTKCIATSATETAQKMIEYTQFSKANYSTWNSTWKILHRATLLQANFE